MKELICMVAMVIMSISSIKMNNEVIKESSIQQIENVELGTFFIL